MTAIFQASMYKRMIERCYENLVPHICVSESGNKGSDIGLLPVRHQAIISTNAELLSIRPLETNFIESLIKIQNFSFMKLHLKILSVKCRLFSPGGDELNSLVQNQNFGYQIWWPFGIGYQNW